MCFPLGYIPRSLSISFHAPYSLQGSGHHSDAHPYFDGYNEMDLVKDQRKKLTLKSYSIPIAPANQPINLLSAK